MRPFWTCPKMFGTFLGKETWVIISRISKLWSDSSWVFHKLWSLWNCNHRQWTFLESLKKRLLKKSEGTFPNKVLGKFCGGFLGGFFRAFFRGKKGAKKSPPKNPRQNSNWNLGVSRPKSTLQGSGLEKVSLSKKTFSDTEILLV